MSKNKRAVLELQRKSQESVRDAADYVIKKFSGKALGPELVLDKETRVGTGTVLLLIFEKMFFRNESYANLTIEITDDTEVQKAVVVGSGGGQGPFNWSLGANQEFAESAAVLLEELGFVRE